MFQVYLIRTVNREGSTRARIIGASYARGDVISYLDSHVEVNRQWLEPIINKIHHNPKTVVMSLLDTISDENFSVKGTFIGSHGGFNWNLEFYWKDVPDEVKAIRSTESEPIVSPIMPAGAFALKRSYFMELGLLDPDMRIWGVDDVEFSFRVWQCGGRVELLPCSRVGHIFRKRIPYSFQDNPSNVIFHNSIRTAEVVLEDYKKFFYAQAKTGNVNVNTTSLAQRKELKQRLKCKSFQWFMKNVIPEMPLPDHDSVYYEFMTNGGDTAKCLEYTEEKTLLLSDCVPLKITQFFSMNRHGILKHYGSSSCLGVNDSHLKVTECKSVHPWKYISQKDKEVVIATETSGGFLCLSGLKNNQVGLRKCDQTPDISQKWNFTYKFDWEKRLSYM